MRVRLVDPHMSVGIDGEGERAVAGERIGYRLHPSSSRAGRLTADDKALDQPDVSTLDALEGNHNAQWG